MLRISVVLPNYNSGETLERAIQSLITQDYPHRQYIIVDSKSTDESPAIIEAYRKYFDHIIIEKDRGQADGINKGFLLATGDIFGWLCADDELLPGALTHIARLFKENPKMQVLTGGCERVFSDGSRIMSPAQSDAWDKIRMQNVIEQPSTFWRADIHRALGPLDLNYHMSFDWDLWIRMCISQARLITTEQVLSRYYFTDSNKSGSAGNDFASEAFRIIKKYGPLRGWLAYIYRFIYYHFDLKGCYDYPPECSKLRWFFYKWTRRILIKIISEYLLNMYNWHFAACQERGRVWWR